MCITQADHAKYQTQLEKWRIRLYITQADLAKYQTQLEKWLSS